MSRICFICAQATVLQEGERYLDPKYDGQELISHSLGSLRGTKSSCKGEVGSKGIISKGPRCLSSGACQCNRYSDHLYYCS